MELEAWRSWRAGFGMFSGDLKLRVWTRCELEAFQVFWSCLKLFGGIRSILDVFGAFQHHLSL